TPRAGSATRPPWSLPAATATPLRMLPAAPAGEASGPRTSRRDTPYANNRQERMSNRFDTGAARRHNMSQYGRGIRVKAWRGNRGALLMRKPEKRLRDVARLAGVSVPTASQEL